MEISFSGEALSAMESQTHGKRKLKKKKWDYKKKVKSEKGREVHHYGLKWFSIDIATFISIFDFSLACMISIWAIKGKVDWCIHFPNSFGKQEV